MKKTVRMSLALQTLIATKNSGLLVRPTPCLECLYWNSVVNRLSSSIHTIHRPLARSHRINIPISSKLSYRQPPQEEDTLEDVSQSEEELENDFEEALRPTDEAPLHLLTGETVGATESPSPFNAMRERAGSLATVRFHRRARLAEKLKEVYDLDDIKEVWAGVLSFIFPCFIRLTRSESIRNALLAASLCLWVFSIPNWNKGLTEMYSTTRIYVSHEFLFVLFCTYAVTRGIIIWNNSFGSNFNYVWFSRTRFWSLALWIRKPKEPNVGSNIGLCSRMMLFLGTNLLR